MAAVKLGKLLRLQYSRAVNVRTGKRAYGTGIKPAVC